MTNIIIVGALGKMGRKVYEASTLIDGVKVVCGVDRFDSNDMPFPVYSDFGKVKENADVIIDFSSPLSLDSILDYSEKNGVPAVICSTGLSKEQVEKINDYSKKVALFRSANMSLGANVLIELVKQATKNLYGFDVEIIEKHHNQKVDAPSGTALMLADAVKEVCPDDYYTYGRQGMVGKRDAKEIGIHAIRGGNIVGEHDVIFVGLNETITLSHQATDRSVFAIGAIKAAQFIKDKKNGLYDMKDVIKG